MKVAVEPRGVVHTRDESDQFVVELPTTFTGPITQLQSVTLNVHWVTTATATVSKARTLVATESNCTLYLPDANEVDSQEFTIKKLNIDGFSLTIEPVNSSQRIDQWIGLIITTQYTVINLLAYNGLWYIT